MVRVKHYGAKENPPEREIVVEVFSEANFGSTNSNLVITMLTDINFILIAQLL